MLLFHGLGMAGKTVAGFWEGGASSSRFCINWAEGPMFTVSPTWFGLQIVHGPMENNLDFRSGPNQ